MILDVVFCYTNFFDTSSGQSDSKLMAVGVLHIHLLDLLLQKHSLV